MSVSNYEEAIALLAANGLSPIDVRRPSEVDIQRLESRLGVDLPESYRRMLLQFGLLQVSSLSISGIGNTGLDGTTASNVVFTTENDRVSKLITKDMLTIAFAGYGPFFVIDCSQLNAKREAPIYEIPSGGVQYGKDKIAEDFGAFLLEEVQKLLEPYDFESEVEDSKLKRTKETSEYWKERSKDFDDSQ